MCGSRKYPYPHPTTPPPPPHGRFFTLDHPGISVPEGLWTPPPPTPQEFPTFLFHLNRRPLRIYHEKPLWASCTSNLRCWILIYQIEFLGLWKRSRKLTPFKRKPLCQLVDLLPVLVSFQIINNSMYSRFCAVLECNEFEKENKFPLNVFTSGFYQTRCQNAGITRDASVFSNS